MATVATARQLAREGADDGGDYARAVPHGRSAGARARAIRRATAEAAVLTLDPRIASHSRRHAEQLIPRPRPIRCSRRRPAERAGGRTSPWRRATSVLHIEWPRLRCCRPCRRFMIDQCPARGWRIAAGSGCRHLSATWRFGFTPIAPMFHEDVLPSQGCSASALAVRASGCSAGEGRERRIEGHRI